MPTSSQADAASPEHIGRAVAVGAATTWVGMVVLLVVEAVVVAIAGHGAIAAHYAGFGFAIAAWIAVGFGGLVAVGSTVVRSLDALGRRVRDRAVPDGLRAVLWGLLVAALALGVMRPWELSHDKYRFDLVLPTAGMVGGWLWSRLADRLGPRASATVAGAVAVVAFAVDTAVLPTLYPRLHQLCAFVAIVFAGVSVHLWAGKARLRRALPYLAVGAAAAQLVSLTSVAGVREVAFRRGALLPKLIDTVYFVLDFDADGVSGWAGGGDCDDFDPGVRPGACERPGHDDNCNGHEGPAPEALAPVAPVEPARRPDVYFVLVDALRADFGRRGTRSQFPAFTAVASTSLDFSAAYAPYPATVQSMMATWQSRAWRYVDPGRPSFPDLLARAGYDVQLWVRRQRLVAGPGAPVVPGFEQNPLHLSGPGKLHWTAGIIDDAVAEIETDTGKPRFRWLHLLDTHQPLVRGQAEGLGLDDIDAYRLEIAHVDEQLGRLLAALDSTDRGRSAVVIVAGDHGDEYGERGSLMHGGTLFDESVRVPLLIRLPGQAPQTVDGPASLVDIVPTVAAYLGSPPDPAWRGHDWLAGPGPAVRVLSQIESADTWGSLGQPTAQMVFDGRFKLIFDAEHARYELYDLAEDPDERRSVVARHPEALDRLQAALARWQDLPGCHTRLGLQ